LRVIKEKINKMFIITKEKEKEKEKVKKKENE